MFPREWVQRLHGRRAARSRTFWTKVGAFEGWGLTSGTFTPQSLFTKCKQYGCQWVAVQDRPATRELIDPLKTAALAHGMELVVWQTRPVTLDLAIECIDLWRRPYIVEVEYEPDGGWEDFATVLRRRYPKKPLGLISNFAGSGALSDGTYSKEDSAPWIRNGWGLITEAYTVNEEGYQQGLEADALDWTAKTHLGWDVTHPAFGIYRVSPDYYADEVSRYGKTGYSWYVAENLP